MIITMMMAIAVGVACGVVCERYRWVRSAKTKKVIAVEGNLYTVTKTDVNAG